MINSQLGLHLQSGPETKRAVMWNGHLACSTKGQQMVAPKLAYPTPSKRDQDSLRVGLAVWVPSSWTQEGKDFSVWCWMQLPGQLWEDYFLQDSLQLRSQPRATWATRHWTEGRSFQPSHHVQPHRVRITYLSSAPRDGRDSKVTVVALRH